MPFSCLYIVAYLGHVISADGVHTSNEKVKRIVQAPAPCNIAELRSFLGLVNYYGNSPPSAGEQEACG